MLVVGIPYVSEYVQYPMTGITLKESPRSNWWGDDYTRWYYILSENGKVVEEVKKYIDKVS